MDRSCTSTCAAAVPAGSRRSRGPALAVALLLAGACSEGTTAPPANSFTTTVLAGDAQFGVPSSELDLPVQILARRESNGAAMPGVRIDWRVVEGSGAVANPSESVTDENGIASTRLRLGSALGTYRIEARSAARNQAPVVTARAVATPIIDAVDPDVAAAGASITITGRNFSSTAGEMTVTFSGMPGTVTSATPVALEVTVPACALTRTVSVRVHRGAVASGTVTMATVASAGATLQLQPGEGRLFSSPQELACVRLPGIAGARYLIVPQNAASAFASPMSFELTGLTGTTTSTVIATGSPADAGRSAFDDPELGIRMLERALGFEGPPALARPPAFATAEPDVGDRRDFFVLDNDDDFVRITAEVVFVSQHAILYQDIEAPPGGLIAPDFAAFGAVFDDPIHEVATAAFGMPSDMDANGRIIILFTPRVNALSTTGSSSFIAGYFYGCDLVSESRCSGTNSAEIFYSIVPDPSGFFGFRHSRETVLRTVPGILAHEFQHMIHWGRTGKLDALWLSEALAHMSEDLVGDELLQRGDTARAADFKLQNFVRGLRYLEDVSGTSLIAESPPGTLELRGGAWLLLKHAAAHHGGQALLNRLTGSSRSSVANLEAETGQAWSRLLADFGTAIWVDGEPDLEGVVVQSRFTYPGFDVRRVLGQFDGGFPLVPPVRSWGDFASAGHLLSASQQYLLLDGPAAGTAPLNLSLSGFYGAPFSIGTGPQFTLFRVR